MFFLCDSKSKSYSLQREQNKILEASVYGVMSLCKVDGKIRIYRQISVILHGADQLHQISILGLPAETAAALRSR